MNMASYRKVSVLLVCCVMFAVIHSVPIIPSPGTDTMDVPTESEETHVVTLSSELVREDRRPIATTATVQAELYLTTASETAPDAAAPLTTTAAALPHPSKRITPSEDTTFAPVTKAPPLDSNLTDVIISAENNVTNDVINATDDVIGIINNITNEVISTINNVTNEVIHTVNNVTNDIINAVNNLTIEFESSINHSISQSQEVKNRSSQFSGIFSQSLPVNSSQNQFSGLFSQLLNAGNSPEVSDIGKGIQGAAQPGEVPNFPQGGNVASIFNRHVARHRRSADEHSAIPNGTETSDTNNTTDESIEVIETGFTLETTKADPVNSATNTLAPELTTAGPSTTVATTAALRAAARAEKTLEETTILPITTALLLGVDPVLNQTNDAERNLKNDIISAENNLTKSINSAENNLTNSIISAISNLTTEIQLNINNSISDILQFANNSQIGGVFSQTLEVNTSQSQINSLFSQSLKVDNSQSQFSSLHSQSQKANRSQKQLSGHFSESVRSKNPTSQFGNLFSQSLNVDNSQSQLNSLFSQTQNSPNSQNQFNGLSSQSLGIDNSQKQFGSLFSQNLELDSQSQSNKLLSQSSPIDNSQSQFSALFSQKLKANSSQNRFNGLFSQSLGIDNSQNQFGGLFSQNLELDDAQSQSNKLLSQSVPIPNSPSQFGSIFSQKLKANSSQNQFNGLFSQSLGMDNSQNQFGGLFSQNLELDDSQSQSKKLLSQSVPIDNSQSQFASLFSQKLKANSSQNQFNGLFSQSLGIDNSQNQFGSLFSQNHELDDSQSQSNKLLSQSVPIDNSQSQFGSLFSQDPEANSSQSQFSRLFSQSLNVGTSQNQFGSLFSQNLKPNDSQSEFGSLSSQALGDKQIPYASPTSQAPPADVTTCLSTPENPDCENRDGEWGPWTSFSECSPLCEQSRHRACDSPKPIGNGRMCEGAFLERRSCDVDRCEPLPQPSNDMGCYRIGDKYYHSGDANNTRTECSQKCAEEDKLFFGVHGVECFCSNVASDGNDLYKVNDTLCTSPCPGDSSETCGGEDGEDSVSSFERTDTNYVGCYKVTDYTREFASQLPDSIKDKSNYCAIACSDRRFRYSMTNKTHCACVNNLFAVAKETAESDCDDKDKKDDSSSISDFVGRVFSGDANNPKRVKRTTFHLHSITSGTNLGCYKAKLLHEQIRVDIGNAERAVNYCIETCDRHGFPLAAVQNPQRGNFVCQCDRGIIQDAENASNCDSFCGKYRCGSDNFESYFSAKCGESFQLGSSITPFNTNASTDLYNRTGSRITWVTSFSAPSNALPSSIGEPLNVNRTALSFQVDLNSPRLVRQLQFSGHAREPVGVTRFVMAVTVDGSVWSFIKVPGTNTHQEFTERGDIVGRNHITKFDFPHLIAVKSARVYVLDFKTFPAFRIDFIGCNADI